MLILALETSCDETSSAIIQDGNNILSNIIATSSNLFNETGGVVPEVAARKQLEYVIPVVEKSLSMASVKLEDIDYFAVTVGPGLVGSLFVGVDFIKTLSLIYNKPIIPVNHLVGHIYSVFIEKYLGRDISNNLEFPFLALVVSGGHTDLVLVKSSSNIEYLGGTRDDAVGESFDKVARILGLSNYLGGVALSKASSKYKGENNLKLPRPMISSNNFDFSFSGLKTASIKAIESNNVEKVANAFEESVVSVLLSKSKTAYNYFHVNNIVVCGGVSANKRLREEFQKEFGKKVIFPILELCTDNAAMIASAAYHNKHKATMQYKNIQPEPSLSLQNL